MAQYMLMCCKPVDDAPEPAAEDDAPPMHEIHRSLRAAGILLDVQRLRPVESATSVRVRAGETEITDGPFALTKEVLAGYYLVECADLDEALGVAARLPGARHGTIEVRPLIPLAEWAEEVEDPA